MSATNAIKAPQEAAGDPEFEGLIEPSSVRRVANGGLRLVGGRCRSCGAVSFPRVSVCHKCLSEDINEEGFGPTGRLYTATVVHQAPEMWDVPYAIGYVDLTDDLRVLAHLEMTADLTIGTTLHLKVANVGTDQTGAPIDTYVFGAEE